MKKILAGYKHIIDDGDCDDHGYFIPKQPCVGKCPSEGGVEFVDVPNEELLKILEASSEHQRQQLQAANLI
jgi:hypothetical protein